MRKDWLKEHKPLLAALLASNVVSLVLVLMRFVAAHNGRYNFMVWNLALGWLPALFAYLFVKQWSRRGPKSYLVWLLGLLWLIFLPNSFYLVSDLIHLYSTGEVSLLFDVVLYASFIFNGFVAGYLSLYLVHKELTKRHPQKANYLIAGAILLSSFAIYLGRNLRWNTWDIVLHPLGIFFDVSDRIIDPVAHPQAAITTLTFFMLIGSGYWVIWEAIKELRRR